MSDFDQAKFDKEFSAIKDNAEVAEWRDVAAYYEQLKPRMRDCFIDSRDPEQLNDKGLQTAADLKAALMASYSTGAVNGTDLEISSGDLNNGFVFNLRHGGGANEPFYTELNGQIAPRAAQAIGSMVGAKLLEPEVTWRVLAKSGGDSTPYIRAQFRPYGLESKRAREFWLNTHYHYMRRNLNTLEVLGQDLDHPYQPMSEVSPEIVKATLALAGAVTQWITSPELGMGITRERVPANLSAIR